MKWNKENERENNNNKWKWTGSSIGDSGAITISESLKTITTLTRLDLSDDEMIEKKKKNIEIAWQYI